MPKDVQTTTQLHSSHTLAKAKESCNPMDCSPASPLSMEFSREEYWSGLPLPFQGDLPDPGIKPVSPALQAESLPTKLHTSK